MWEILLPSSDDCLAVASHKLITKHLIIWTEYQGRWGTKVAVYAVPQVLGEHIVAYFEEYREILGTLTVNLNRGWSFNIMLDRKAFHSIPNCLVVVDQYMLVIVTGCKPKCWKCRETGHISLSSTEKKAPVILVPIDQNFPLAVSVKSALPVMCMPATEIYAVKPLVGFCPTFLDKPLPTTCAVVEEEMDGHWQGQREAPDSENSVTWSP